MEEKELWMNKLKEKLADYSEPVPASGWEQLEKELMPPVEKKIYPYRKWMMAAAAVILLAVVSSVSLYFLGTPAADEIRHIKTPALASTPDALPGVQQPDVQDTSVDPVLRPVAREDRLAKIDKNLTEQKTNADQSVIENNNESVTGNENSPVIEEGQTLKGETEQTKNEAKQVVSENVGQQATQSQDTERSNNRSRRPSGRDKLHMPTEKRASQKGTWSMGLSVGNSGRASTEVGAGSHAYMSRVNMLSVSNGLMEIPNDQTLVFEDGVPYLRQAKQVVDIKHHQPISFGLSVRKGLAKGFSLETGLTYTLLSSDAKLAGEDRQIEQKLHYVGIPLRANWNFLDKKLVTLYVSGGGMVEKCVYGKLGSEKETVKPLQFSVSGAVGAQVNATKRLGVYVEPGVAYFFDDGSDIQTIRKENPFNFNIQAGIRLTY
ncbi:MAG: PorT family protein [Bacteroides sp.]|nr:PorT family protein [Bacteroides sp.]